MRTTQDFVLFKTEIEDSDYIKIYFKFQKPCFKVNTFINMIPRVRETNRQEFIREKGMCVFIISFNGSEAQY